ncbi:hypothetical protein PR202_ga12013 [Eleusine coracana subsp. coracana]|uniref:NB-ARC domain-containing protein n=1 Tax=Eleusine coracana subsp. coracana TaxID=191504 RepID=A0AAV5CB13_ELECO|nr:hypothetical protein PR202_ga12013 [Eleusine coracana subsp. coracana]
MGGQQWSAEATLEMCPAAFIGPKRAHRSGLKRPSSVTGRHPGSSTVLMGQTDHAGLLNAGSRRLEAWPSGATVLSGFCLRSVLRPPSSARAELVDDAYALRVLLTQGSGRARASPQRIRFRRGRRRVMNLPGKAGSLAIVCPESFCKPNSICSDLHGGNVRVLLCPLICLVSLKGTLPKYVCNGSCFSVRDIEDCGNEVSSTDSQRGDKEIGNKKSSNWLKRLKDAAYDVEDVVHEFYMEAEKLDSNVVGINNIVIKYVWTRPKSLVFKYKIAHKIKEIRKRFDAIVKGRSDYSTITNSISVDHHDPYISKTIGEIPFFTTVDERSIFGRDQFKLQLISELIQSDEQQKIKIISVIGLGGSGKTTLAKLVYNDDKIIKKHFEIILWIHVSREFDVENLLKKLFEAIDGNTADHHASQRMSRIISNKLATKKFLLVLDDVWTEDHLQWEQFMVNLMGGAPGSSILLTTRNRRVAEAVDSTYTHDLPLLSEEDSWNVFLQCFGRNMEALDPEFQQVGTQIVKKCGGVPLAIKVLAGALRRMKRIDEWKSIRDNNLLDVEDEQHRVSNCLLLSYVHLPHHLKQCFTHCSIFPRGYVLNRRHLISQWIANGFINPTNQAQQLEEVGIDYFESLLNVGFLQDLKQYHGIFGEETTCKMHDLVHDLSRQILQEELVSEITTTDQINRCRYLSLTSGTREVHNELFIKMVESKLFAKVRALYISRGNITFDKSMYKRCCVKTIILERIRSASLPLFVSKFEHLGYLEVSNIDCEALPRDISHCRNLQAIHVIKCTRIATLPDSIGRLKKLRILELKGCSSFTSLPESIGGCDSLHSLCLSDCGLKNIPDSVANIVKLRVLSIVCCTKFQQLLSSESLGKLCNLRTITLCYYRKLQHLPQCITLLSRLECVDLSKCGNLVELPEGTGDSTKHARISELENLDKLNGKLNITNIINVNDPYDAKNVHLENKNGIRKLSLDWYSRGKIQARKKIEESVEEPPEVIRTKIGRLLDMEKDLYLLNNLEPPSGIENLRIRGYRGFQLPRWMVKQSGSCDLDDMYMPEQHNPPQFSHLTKLVLENLSNIEHLQGLVDLPGIMVLKLRRMPKLMELLTTRTYLESGQKEMEMQYCFPQLSYFVISDCPKLMVKPYFPPSLQRLTLDRSNEQLLSSGNFFLRLHAHGDEPASSSFKPSHLTELKLKRLIESSPGWDVLRHLTGLQVLEISGCKDLRQLPESMRSLNCLLRLKVTKCGNLCMLPEWLGELRTLESLDIEGLPKISSLPQSIQHLTALQDLDVIKCKALHCLPEQLGELCSLHSLQIFDLPALTCLPESMQSLSSLRFLNLGSCDSLTQLPESLGELSALRRLWIQSFQSLTSLPRFIQRLYALEELRIYNCPELIRRCKEGEGRIGILSPIFQI